MSDLIGWLIAIIFIAALAAFAYELLVKFWWLILIVGVVFYFWKKNKKKPQQNHSKIEKSPILQKLHRVAGRKLRKIQKF